MDTKEAVIVEENPSLVKQKHNSTEEAMLVKDEPSPVKENLTPTAEEIPMTVSPLESNIIRQVEYYFGNFNLCRDKFLREQVQLNDGWVPMETMLKFNRLKELSSDSALITGALKKSPNQLLEVNEDGTQIRRSVLKPVPQNRDEQWEEINKRSIYAKGFASDVKLDELIEFFKQFGCAENILMKRRPNKMFKGSVFVTFTNVDDAKNFMQQKNIKFRNRELLKESKLDYLKRKSAIRQEYMKRKETKKRKFEESKQENENGDEATKSKVEKVEEEEEEDEEETGSSITKGCLLRLSGLSESTMWEHIKEVLAPHGAISYVDYSRGKETAVVRFESPIAAEILEKVSVEEDNQKRVKINDVSSIAVVIRGKEEINYWKDLEQSKTNFRKQKRNEKSKFSRGSFRGGFRGGNRSGRGRHHGNNQRGRS